MGINNCPLALLVRRWLVSLTKAASMEGQGQKAVCSGLKGEWERGKGKANTRQHFQSLSKKGRR